MTTQTLTLDEIADLAEKAGCDVSALDGREYQTMWCDSEQLQKFVALILANPAPPAPTPPAPGADDLETIVAHLRGIQEFRSLRDWAMMHLEISEAIEFLQKRNLL